MPPTGASKEKPLNNLHRLSTSAVSVADSLQAKQDLEWIAARWNDLKARLLPSSTPNTGAARPAPTSRPPLNLHISDLLHTIEVEARMLGWTLMEETPGGWRPTSSAMPQLLIDVAQHHGHWTTQDDQTALAFTDWANEYRHRVERALENPPNPTYLGPCQHCQNDYYVKPRATVAKCRGCHGTIDIRTQMAWVQQQLQDRLMTLSEIRLALNILDIPVPYNTIKSWAHRGRLLPQAEGLYRLGDAKQLAEEHAERRRSA